MRLDFQSALVTIGVMATTPKRRRITPAAKPRRSYAYSRPFESLFQFKIALQEIEPTIWRQVQVPDTYTFWDLHCAITDCFGWLDYHLHQFKIFWPEGDETDIIGIPDKDRFEDDPETLPGWHLYISEYFSKENPTCDYEYDFGDGWRHSVTLEKILSREEGVTYPRCIGGENACPPEDVGGLPGYYRFLKAIRYHNAPDHDELLQWCGGWFDPSWLDLSLIQFEDPDLRFKVAFRGKPIPKGMRVVQYHRMKGDAP